jgi:hypothetical protein
MQVVIRIDAFALIFSTIPSIYLGFLRQMCLVLATPLIPQSASKPKTKLLEM